MNVRWVAPVDRARQELHVARLLLDSGLPSQAISHAYYAGYQVAVAALDVVGERPATESGVISAFGRRVVGEGGLDREIGRALRKLFEDRLDVDRALLEAPAEEARHAITGAERLVDAARRWIERQPG